MRTTKHSFEQISKLLIFYNLVCIGVEFINLVANFNLILSPCALENLFAF